jgi:hypothetical protein
MYLISDFKPWIILHLHAHRKGLIVDMACNAMAMNDLTKGKASLPFVMKGVLQLGSIFTFISSVHQRHRRYRGRGTLHWTTGMSWNVAISVPIVGIASFCCDMVTEIGPSYLGIRL